MTAQAVKTTCPYCGVGCGILATRAADGAVTIAGDREHPANFGRLCSKGAALGETLSLDDRLLTPLINGGRASWDMALDLVAARFAKTIADHGPESVAFYVSGQILTEDYYVANKLMKGFVGSANIDTNSRLCMASSVAGHKRAFGSDTVPGTYEDLELADLVVLVGSNLAWCHPVLYQRLLAAREKRGTKIVVIDPRRTSTCENADLHLPLASGSDVALFNGLLRHLDAEGSLDHDYIEEHTNGLSAALNAARNHSPVEVARLTRLNRRDIIAFYQLFEATSRTVTVYSQGVNQSSAGTDKVNAIINCHLATGRIGKPGAGPFSVTGQPNAMGGREVGGLSNMLAAHMELDNADHRNLVQNFWQSPHIADKPGLKAVDLFRAVGDGRIKALWIMGTNPVDSMPEADTVRAALKACPLVVVSDVVRHTDTTAYAHVLLPATAWGEKDGTVTNSERRISRQRAFLPAPGEARPDWWQLAEVGKRMGFADAFNYSKPSEIFTEHARLSATANNGTRDFDIGACGAMSAATYDDLAPFQWPRPDAAPANTRFFANGGFFTPTHRANLVPTPYRAPATQTTSDYPLILNTGRIRDQWHTMTRTGKSPRLSAHIGEPFVEVHPDDVERFGLKAAELATISTRYGSAIVRVLVTDRQQLGTLFAPIHWTDQNARMARVGALTGGAVDPNSGQPELKHTPARIASIAAKWYAFAVASERPVAPLADYITVAPIASGWRVELAGCADILDWAQAVGSMIAGSAGRECLSYHDVASGQQRWALFDGSKLLLALFVAPAPVAVARSHLASLLAKRFDTADARHQLLAGRAPADQPDTGAIICACLNIGRNQILAARRLAAKTTIDDIGKTTGAGTNCGSCRAEIGALLR
jgi:assimilatory nitrate reductase catalytic subunit